MEVKLIESTINLGDIEQGKQIDFSFSGEFFSDSPELFKVKSVCGCMVMETDYTVNPGSVELKGYLKPRRKSGKATRNIKILEPVEKTMKVIYNVK